MHKLNHDKRADFTLPHHKDTTPPIKRFPSDTTSLPYTLVIRLHRSSYQEVSFLFPYFIGVMEDAVADFCAITGATPQVARHFLSITDGDPSQAIQLFFDSPDLASAAAESASHPPTVPISSRPSARHVTTGREDEHGVVHIDSDDDIDIAMDDADEDAFETAHTPPAASSANIPQSSAYEDDEAMARRLQEEMYAGGDMASGFGADDVRAPLSRTTETLVGGDWGPEDIQGTVLQQMRQRGQPRPSEFTADSNYHG